tara:strand:- start:453 stop:749 length:297 start_codon:yes stop_codon:yes gene_type:complete
MYRTILVQINDISSTGLELDQALNIWWKNTVPLFIGGTNWRQAILRICHVTLIEFITAISDADLAAFIKQGRPSSGPSSDPANTTALICHRRAQPSAQ